MTTFPCPTESPPVLQDDPLAPFGVLGGPAADLAVSDDALNRALALVLASYEDNKALGTRIRKARKALRRLPDDDSSEPQWIIQRNGDLLIKGSEGTYYYRTSDTECLKNGVFTQPKKGGGSRQVYCPGFIFGTDSCYHALARELLRMAQVLAHGAEAVALAHDAVRQEDEEETIESGTSIQSVGEQYSLALTEAGEDIALTQLVLRDVADMLTFLTRHGEGRVTIRYEASEAITFSRGDAAIRLRCEGYGCTEVQVEPEPLITFLDQLQVDQTDELMFRFGATGILTIITDAACKNFPTNTP